MGVWVQGLFTGVEKESAGVVVKEPTGATDVMLVGGTGPRGESLSIVMSGWFLRTPTRGRRSAA